MKKVKAFKNRKDWQGTNFPSEKDSVIIALNALPAKKEKFYSPYVPKHNSNRQKQVIFFAVKQLSALLREITSKHHSDFYYLNCLHLFATENKHEFHENVCENKDFCNIIMPSEDNKIAECN